MDLKTIESELKEHAKAEARRLLADARAGLADLMGYLKALESGDALKNARASLANVQAKVKNLEDGVEAEITRVRGEIESALRSIEEHKLNVKEANQASKASPDSSPAPLADQSASTPAPEAQSDAPAAPAPEAPAPAADQSAPAPAPALNDAGVTSPDAPAAPAPASDSGNQTQGS